MSKRSLSFFPALFAGALVLSSCTLAPEYHQPEAPVSAGWPAGTAYPSPASEGATSSAPDTPWQAFFTDERLKEVITLAIVNNRDLRLAALNAERVRAFYNIQRAELFPTVNALASGFKQRSARMFSGTPDTISTEHYNVDLGVSSWELDLFGRLRSLEDKALEEYLASEQAQRGAQIALISQVARSYLSLIALRENLAVANSTLEAQQSALKLLLRRQQLGLSDELSVRQVQTRVDAAQIDIAIYTRLVAQQENALVLLLAGPIPGEQVSPTLDTLAPVSAISPGATSSVLLSRPDVLEAEHLLKGSNANIGAARAAFFPRITLTGSVGTASTELSQLFKGGTWAWTVAPAAVMPIFDTRVRSAARAIEIEHEIALTQYGKTIQVAFKEVADSLAVRGTIEAQFKAQQSFLDSAAETYRLANIRYLKGLDSYLAVTTAQSSLYAAQQALINVRLEKLANEVRLYEVLGGGAEPAPEV